MNILFMPSWYETAEEPNSGNFFTEQALALKHLGNNVTIAIADIINFPYKSKAPVYRVIKELRHGIDVYRIAVPSLMTGQIPGLFFSYYTHYYKKLLKFMKSNGLEFDIIYAHSFWHAGYIGTILKEQYHIPLIIQEHRSMLVSGEFSDKVNRYLKHAILLADAFYSVSNGLRDNMYHRTGLKEGIEILPDMVDDLFCYQPLENSEFTYTFIGTLNDRKRVMQLLGCFEAVRRDNENVCLQIAGDGPLRERINERISNSDILKGSVFLLGFLGREAVSELLAKANVLVLPSEFEPFGVVCIEAMATGRPVICTKNGATDFVNESNGILIDVDSDEQLIAAMKKIYKDYGAYDLQAISKLCTDKYSKGAVMGKLMSKMREICAYENTNKQG